MSEQEQQQHEASEVKSASSAQAASEASASPAAANNVPANNAPTKKPTAKQVKELTTGYFEKTEDYKHFKEWVPIKMIETLNPNKKSWTYFQYGTRSLTPLVMIHGLSGTADSYFQQILSLSIKGYHIISVDIPPCYTHDEFLLAFDDFLSGIQQEKVHLLGSGLGGFLAVSYAEYKPDRVDSIILCNSFVDTAEFHKNAPCVEMFAIMPAFMLKKFILNAYPQTPQEIMIIRSLDFMIDKLESLSQKQIASRMTLNCTPRYIQKLKIPDERITIIDCISDTIYPASIRDNVYKLFPNARLAFLKDGGDFPYLSRDAEFTMHVQVHLRSVAQQNLVAQEQSVKPNPKPSNEDMFLSSGSNEEGIEVAQEEKKEQAAQKQQPIADEDPDDIKLDYPPVEPVAQQADDGPL